MEKITWSAPEYHYYEKDASWYWFVLLGTILIVGLALWQRNFLFALFIIIAAVLVISWGSRKPNTVDFTLSEKGIDIGGKKFYAFENLSGFAIIPSHDDSEISEFAIQTKGRIGGWTKIIVATDQIENVKAFLASHVPELEYEESLADHLTKLLRF